jgi:phospholipase A-2-activating protein
LPNNDIVIACSDGTIRIFTQDETRVASKSECEAFEHELSVFAIPTKTDETMSKINRSELPGIEALSNPGRKDGQTIMINNENEVEVYSWSEVDTRWVKIGVAVGSATSSGGSNRDKVKYDGKEYDFVFDISLDDEGTALKLPYNLSEDPWRTAQDFIHKHELSQAFLDQIAQFIITNTKGETITGQGETYVDPFTGESRYTPGGSASIADNPPSYYDPFTGQSRYTPGGSVSNVATSGSYQDPFTGNAYRSAAADKQTISNANEYYPQSNFVLFEQRNIPTIINKIKELQVKNSSEVGIINVFENVADSTSNELSAEFHGLILLLTTWSQGELLFLPRPIREVLNSGILSVCPSKKAVRRKRLKF